MRENNSSKFIPSADINSSITSSAILVSEFRKEKKSYLTCFSLNSKRADNVAMYGYLSFESIVLSKIQSGTVGFYKVPNKNNNSTFTFETVSKYNVISNFFKLIG